MGSVGKNRCRHPAPNRSLMGTGAVAFSGYQKCQFSVGPYRSAPAAYGLSATVHVRGTDTGL